MEGLVEAMYAAATPLAVEGRVLDVVGHRRRPVVLGEHLHDGRDRGGRRRRHRGQARQPVGLVEGRQRRRARAARHPARPARPPTWPGSPARPGITFCFAAAFHPALRHAAGARSELGVGHQLQLPRPDRQPGQPGRPGDRLRRPADGAGDGRRVRPPRRRRLGVPRRRRSRRADHDHDARACGRSAGARSPSTPSTRPRSASPRGPPRGCAVRTRRTTPTSCAACWPARPGRCATPYCSTRARRWRCTPPRPGRSRSSWRAGIARATEAVDSGAAQATLERWVAATALSSEVE